MTDMVIISGFSGSGKSVALQSLEDIGYYCIDNLPAFMLQEFSTRLPEKLLDSDAPAIPGIAVSIDSRNKGFLAELDTNLNSLEKLGIHYRILFLDAEEQKLVRRYSETRRKHPLTDIHTPLIEGIRQESNLLGPLHNRAEKIIDTTEMTPHELRGLVRDFAGGVQSTGPLLLVESFGFKYGTPREADFVFDVRCMPNPYWQKDLRPLTGLDQRVKDFLVKSDAIKDMTGEIFQFMLKWLPGFAGENRSYITVAIGCTGGQHRSVYISEQLYNLFLEQDVNVQIRHRELAK
jgi:UPF0042 nucleotide-binding protein